MGQLLPMLTAPYPSATGRQTQALWCSSHRPDISSLMKSISAFMGKTAALKVHTAPFLDTPKGSAQSKKMSSSTSVANEAKECISPRTLLMWVHTSIEKWARKTDMLQNISTKCNVNMKSACLKKWCTNWNGRQSLHCVFYWRHSKEQISHSEVWESADRSRRSVRMTGQVPWATVW